MKKVTIIKITSFEYFLVKYVKSLLVRKVLLTAFWDIYKFVWKITRAIYNEEITAWQDVSLPMKDRASAFLLVPTAVMQFLTKYKVEVKIHDCGRIDEKI